MGQYVDEGQGHFRIEYRPPFGGIDTSVPSQFIAPNNLVAGNNTIIRNGMYTPAALKQITFTGSGAYNPNNQMLGLGELPFLSVNSAGLYNTAGAFYVAAIYAAGNATVQVFQVSTINGGTPTNIGTLVIPAAGPLGRLTYIVINQVVYLSAPGLSGIIKLANTPGTNAFVATTLTTQLGCSYLAELDGRLLGMNIWQGAAGAVVNSPYQIAWSADSQQYGVWNVLDVNSNPTGAGFNNLPDVEDVITGAFFNGPTGYIIRQQGITEITPLNSGIQPYNFNHLWASRKGIGSIWPNTICQYGPQGCFLSETDIFVMGLSGLNPIGGMAKGAIYNTIYNANTNNVFATCCPMVQGITDKEPELFFILLIEQSNGTVVTHTLFIYGFESKAWTTVTITGGFGFDIVDISPIDNTLISGGSLSYVQPVFVFQGLIHPPVFYQLVTNDVTIAGSTLVFPTEIITALQDVTIDGIAIFSPSNDASTINPVIQGSDAAQNFGTLATNSGTTKAPGYFKFFPPGGKPSSTLRSPQLTINYNGTAQIGHVVIYGTTTPGRPF